MPCRSPASSFGRAFALLAVLALTGVACTGGSPVDRGGSPSGSRIPPVVTYRLQVRSASFSLRAPLEREVAGSLDNEIYLAGGLGSAGTSASGVFSLDPSTGKLSALGAVPQAFHDAAGAVLDGKLYVFGGGTGESSNAVQSFDLQSHRSEVAGHLPHALSDLSSAAVGGSVYLVGGWDGAALSRTVWSTTDGRTFRAVAQLPEGLRYTAVAATGSKVVVAGGVDVLGKPVDTISVLDTEGGQLRIVGHLPHAVGHASAFTLGGRVFVAGGTGADGRATAQVVEVDPSTGTVSPAATLRHAVSDAGTVVSAGAAWLVGGSNGSPVTTIQRAELVRHVLQPSASGQAAPSPSEDPASVRPFAGLLLIADRGNNRLLVVNAHKRVVWRYPDPSLPAPPFRFYFPDDAFWVHGGHAILVSEEENNVIQEIAYPGGETIWSAGHPGVAGSAAGSLSQPDDAYPAPGGGVMVADAKNCRIQFFDANGRPSRQVGKTGNADVAGSCYHGLPDHIAYPNGDTPLPNGHFLISELRGGGWIDEVDANGRPVWQTHVPGVSLPSDPQRLADGTFLTVDYNTPGRIVRFTSGGKAVWDYFVQAGHGELGNPSLAAPLPNGLIGVNDDFRHRMILIDPATKQIVWQYGHDDRPGTGHGFLNIPDGFDLLLPDGSTPLHVDFASDQVVPGKP